MSVVDELVEQMLRKIIAGVWPPGSVLPSLREFAAEAGVSMLTVREAVRTLQARGWVETRHGIGTFVLEVEPETRYVPWPLGASDVDEYAELVEARQSIESTIIDFGSRRRTEEQLTRLDELLDKMEDALHDHARFLVADADFHVVLAEAAHNRILLRTMLAIRSPMRRLMANRLIDELAVHGSLARSVADHRAMVDGLRGHDPALGRSGLDRITDRARSHLSEIGSVD